MEGGGPIAPADDATDREDGDVDQEVFAIARVPGVAERFEGGLDRADVDELRHGGHPWIGRCQPPHAELACGPPITTTARRISSRCPSRQTAQALQLCALAVAVRPTWSIARRNKPGGCPSAGE